MKKTYIEKLRDPRWQKRRLEVFERDQWTCMFCGDTKTTLNVHHLSYSKSGNPWDTPLPDLVTLCETCHEGESLRSDYEHDLLLEMKRSLFDAADVYVLARLIISFNREINKKFKFVDLMAHFYHKPGFMQETWEEIFKNPSPSNLSDPEF